MHTFTLPAPAKLNRFLHILGQRHDGYHELQTIFHLLEYSDELSFTLRKDAQIIVDNHNVELSYENNLIVRAARLLQQSDSRRLGVEITLHKKIPLGAGLGGGSSNAATTLIGLNHLWQLKLPLSHLAQLGAQLGADVPVFVTGKSAWGEGVGEKLTPLKLPDCWFVVIIPPVHISTIEIFCNNQLTRDSGICKISASLLTSGRNDCEPVVRSLYPDVNAAIEWLQQFATARMTGTGCGVFASFETEAKARNVAQQVPTQWKCFISRGVNESPLHTALKNLSRDVKYV